MSDEGLRKLRPAEDLKLHHVGFVVPSIQECAESYALALGATWDGNIVFDPLQKVRVTFFEGRSSTDPLIELVEPGGFESPVSRFLERGGGLHHLCYEVEDLESHLAFCKSVGTIVLRPPVPAVAFGGRRIAWAMTRKKLLLEFLESSLQAK
jgi:methylmalonyl-CoA/ethylmalonyl-CoA epimerase